MVKPPAAPVENSIFNLFLQLKKFYSTAGKVSMGYPEQNVGINAGPYCRLEKVCAVGTGAVITAEEAVTV